MALRFFCFRVNAYLFTSESVSMIKGCPEIVGG